MRRFINWVTGRKTEELKIEASKPEIAVGSKWTFKSHTGDPFQPKRYPPSVVLEVKDGWVRYYLGTYFPDERRTVESFLSIYEEDK